MQTARTLRRFADRPVAPELMHRCLEAATWAPSGGNQQPWHFVVIDSGEGREALRLGAARALAKIETVYSMTRPAPDDDSPRARNARATYALHDGAANVPAAVLFCVAGKPYTPQLMLGGSIFPAVQNFLLAARALGLGTCATSWQVGADAELRAALGIPDEWQLATVVVVGHPTGRHGPVRRRPVPAVASHNHWDVPFVGSAAD